MLPEHGTLNRGYYLGKYWKRLGHEPIIFAGSHPHNTDLQLIEDNRTYKVYQDDPFPWVLIKTRKYGKSRKQQIISMVEYYLNARKASQHFGKPDVIIGSSAHPLAAYLAIKLAKKYKCRSIVEIRDLWPESIIEYGLLKRTSLVAKAMVRFEKWLYTHADKVVFTQEAAYRYIEDLGWEKDIPHAKVDYICNGTDQEEFSYNLEHYRIKDDDLEDPDTFKVIYTGAIKLVNNVGLLIDVAKEIHDKKVRILVWGDGDEQERVKKRVDDEKVDNIIFKGRTEKRNIPYILSKGDLGLIHIQKMELLKYGFSPNKLFDYLTAGKPVVVDCEVAEDPVVKYHAGEETDITDPKSVAKLIEKYARMSQEELGKYINNARIAAALYSYLNLARRYTEIICEC